MEKAAYSHGCGENTTITMQEEIKTLYAASNRIYGAPKMMKALGLKSASIKKYRSQPSKADIPERENLLNQDFTTTGINQKWCTDITYIYVLSEGGTDLASVLDCHSRKIIGYTYDNARIDPFHSTLKKEELYRHTYRTLEDAQASIFRFIES